jgi:hypothetical protein
MNYQLLRKAPTNYQLDQNRAFNYQRQPFSPFRQSEGLKQTVNGSRDRHMLFHPHFLHLFPYELSPSSNMPPCKTTHDSHMTR